MLRSKDFWVGAIVGVVVVAFVLPKLGARKGGQRQQG